MAFKQKDVSAAQPEKRMLEIDIPGFDKLQLEHLVLDFNGTLALDGHLLPGVADLLRKLSEHLRIHVVTADTFAQAANEVYGLPVELRIVKQNDQADEKLDFINRLDAEHVAAIGNGRNDRKMLRRSALGIAVIQREGVAQEALDAADIVTSGIADALALLLHPLRLTATLRA